MIREVCFLYFVIVSKTLAQESIHYSPAQPITFVENTADRNVTKREADSTFKGHPKTREEKWAIAFRGVITRFDQDPSLIGLLYMLVTNHLNECTPVILYDNTVENSDMLFLQQLMKSFPFPYVHGKISKDNAIANKDVLATISKQCVNYILFMADVMKSAELLGMQATSKVVVVARSSQWRVQEFLYNKASRTLVNLLIIAQSFRDDDTIETPYILYTHELYIDGLGASRPTVLTSWTNGKLAQPHVSLFPSKMMNGYAGHRFSVVAADQPPFVFKKTFRDFLGNPIISWEGVEYRLLNLLGEKNNFSIEIKEPEDLSVGSGDAIWNEISRGKADMGIGGVYVTADRQAAMDLSISHSQDCAAFISLTSTALPRYRAIMGPFHWTVWVALTFTYLFGIFPLAFSDKHTLRHLIHNSGEVENMFWYVFGTFTNCFTFVGKNSWSRTTKITTRLLIGLYWIFTIIITACYTGSIIAFVTLPIYPATVDTVEELLSGHYRVGTLDRGGWEKWFLNSSDRNTNRLLKHLELVPTVEAGLRNTTRAFFWSYAFLGSKYQLEYIVQSNFTLESSKRAQLHISDTCFVPFGISVAFPKESVYTEKLNIGILRIMQSGIITKLMNDVKWKMQRSSTGKLLQVSSGSSLRSVTADERGLSLGDTQGMFLLLGAGFLTGAAALLSEWMGGCGRMFKRWRVKSASSTVSTTTVTSITEKSHMVPTPNSKTDDKSEYDILNLNDANFDIIEEAKSVKAQDKIIEENCTTTQESSDISKLSDNEELSSISNEEAVNVQNLKVSADIVHMENETSKGHSRRPSYVDWDNEINELFHYTKIEAGSDDEQNKKDTTESEVVTNDEKEQEVEKLDVFGEKVNT